MWTRRPLQINVLVYNMFITNNSCVYQQNREIKNLSLFEIVNLKNTIITIEIRVGR